LIEKDFFKAPHLDQIKSKLQSLIPQFNLPIPAFSAKKKDGKRLYHLARRGIQDLEYKNMKIY
jgi:tRNA U55 pseudouridine synthase TruB